MKTLTRPLWSALKPGDGVCWPKLSLPGDLYLIWDSWHGSSLRVDVRGQRNSGPLCPSVLPHTDLSAFPIKGKDADSKQLLCFMGFLTLLGLFLCLAYTRGHLRVCGNTRNTPNVMFKRNNSNHAAVRGSLIKEYLILQDSRVFRNTEVFKILKYLEYCSGRDLEKSGIMQCSGSWNVWNFSVVRILKSPEYRSVQDPWDAEILQCSESWRAWNTTDFRILKYLEYCSVQDPEESGILPCFKLWSVWNSAVVRILTSPEYCGVQNSKVSGILPCSGSRSGRILRCL